MATQQLAMIQYHAGDRPQAYMLLREAQDDLGEEAIQLLHELAFEEKNYPLVADLAARAYQHGQGAEIALRSAYACAQLKQVRQAVGWLFAVRERSTYSVQEIIQKSFFDPIRQEPLFEHFVASLNR